MSAVGMQALERLRERIANVPVIVTIKKLPGLPAGTRCEVFHEAGDLLLVRLLDQSAWAWVRRSEVSEHIPLTIADLVESKSFA